MLCQIFDHTIGFLILILLFSSGVGLGWYVRSQTIKPQADLPSVLNRALSFLVQRGEVGDEDLLYHDVGLANFIVNGSSHTKASVEGIVDKVTQEPDGDYHILVRPQYAPVGLFLVTETIPEIKDLPIPNKGDHIRIWGITRFDEPHNWWELHPVIGWEKL